LKSSPLDFSPCLRRGSCGTAATRTIPPPYWNLRHQKPLFIFNDLIICLVGSAGQFFLQDRVVNYYKFFRSTTQGRCSSSTKNQKKPRHTHGLIPSSTVKETLDTEGSLVRDPRLAAVVNARSGGHPTHRASSGSLCYSSIILPKESESPLYRDCGMHNASDSRFRYVAGPGILPLSESRGSTSLRDPPRTVCLDRVVEFKIP